MLYKSFLCLAAFAASLVRSAPLNLHGREASNDVPDYVLKYAPIVYLHKDEQYFPTDIKVFLDNTTPRVNFKEVSAPTKPLTTTNVNKLGGDVFLTSNDDVTKDPAWLKGTKPNAEGRTEGAITAAVLLNDKGNGDVDVFYMYFYAYNYGGNVLGWSKLNFGNHVGDWEHTMLRFSHGVPQSMWFSQHADGQAFLYSSVHKSGLRPIVYASKGSHANYAIPGIHDHVIPNFNLPGGVLEDYTAADIRWDPVQSAWFYEVNATEGTWRAYDDKGPTEWLAFRGKWGDEEYPESDERQVKLFGQAKFSNGPTGPMDKQLNREKVCPENGMVCILRSILVPRRRGEEEGVGEGDEVLN